jgi:hypothetical protein
MRQSVPHLIRIACVLALVGLAMTVYPLFVPDPLPVILAMSVGQAVGVGAVGAFLLAVLVDAARTREPDEDDEAAEGQTSSPSSHGEKSAGE